MKLKTASLLCLLAACASSGCLVIEKKTLVMLVPPGSSALELYYVFEGLSVHRNYDGAGAKNEVDLLRKDNFSFFVQGQALDGPLLQYCRFDKLRFFTDPKRDRALCADRRMTIPKRDEFAAALNKAISDSFPDDFLLRDDAAILKQIKDQCAEFRRQKDGARRAARDFGVGPLMKIAEGVLEFADEFDLESIRRLKVARKFEFRWVRFEPDLVMFVLPATRPWAQKIVADPRAKDWLKEMRTFVEPIDLAVKDDGLAIVLGKKGQAIRLVYADDRPHEPGQEAVLAQHVGSPGGITLPGGAPANAESLIKQFSANAKRR